ncbi:unnamed protein product [Urochloa decumbens]|uniref:Cytochrome P450 n=1 Tax=Urochloa decumbens TaxID=240449 RepID=A0ABC9ENB5_9POAL
MAADLLLALLLAIIPLIILLFFATRRRSPRNPGTGIAVRLPPGPWALPVIGHLHHLAAASALPHRALRNLARRHGALMSLRLGELPVMVASSPAAAREIMKTHDAAFASRPMSPMQELAYQGSHGVIFAPYGEGWRQLRKICALELLSARRVSSFRAVREDEACRLLGSIAAAAAARSPVNLSELVAAYVADSTVRAIIGSRFDRRDEYLRMLQEGLKIVPGMTLPDLFPSSRLARLVSRAPAQIERHRNGMLEFIDDIIAEHRESRKSGEDNDDEDLLDVLLRLQKEVDSQYPLTTENIKTVMLDMFGAGSETSATTLQWAMAELMRNPRVMQKTQDEVRRALAGDGKVKEGKLGNLHYLPLVIKETLRLHPPAPLLLPRRCGSTCQVLGFDIPEGTMVIVNAWAIGRDPAHWEEPDEFMPERFEDGGRDFRGLDFEFIPFGAGRRMCPGMAFGLAHIELALAALLFHFDWELPGGTAAEELDLTEAFGVTTQLRSDLVVVPIPRFPVSTG